MKRVTHKAGKREYAAKFISARAKRKASALREMNILSHLDRERIIYFHDAFEKKNAVIIITEMYPFHYSTEGETFRCEYLFQSQCYKLVNTEFILSE